MIVHTDVIARGHSKIFPDYPRINEGCKYGSLRLLFLANDCERLLLVEDSVTLPLALGR
jgi:hypothetical protein